MLLESNLVVVKSYLIFRIKVLVFTGCLKHQLQPKIKSMTKNKNTLRIV